jgi:cysteine/O-acetylserine efflux protein
MYNMNYAAFFSYVFLMTFSPGPNNIMAMSNASKYGFKKSLPFNLGVIIGFIILMCGCAAFSALLYNLIPAIKPYMLGIGACYILLLAWIIWQDKSHGSKSGPVRSNTVLSGMLLQFINVKVILYGITAMSSFILPNYHDFWTLSAFVLLLSVVGFASTCCWGAFGAIFEKFLKRYSRWVNAVMALLLVYCAFSMVLEILS